MSPAMKRRVLILLGLLLVGALLRGWAVIKLPLDFDEPTYLQAGVDYAAALQAGDWNSVIDYAENREHPALVKLLYGMVLLALGPDSDPFVALLVSRAASALLGTLAALALALFDPLAGGLLAGHTLTVKYTSQVYLEALPHLASLIAVLALCRSASPRDRWFWLSALALGVTAAGKLAYLPIIPVIFYLALWEKHYPWRNLLLYLVCAGAVFWLLNPTLWHDPLGRMADMLFFHVRYSQSTSVERVGYPWYQPLYWLSSSPALSWHPNVFFYFALDGVICLLALFGLYWEWRERRWVVVWIVTGLLFLLAWPTKWPQYTLVLVPALCLVASSAARHAYAWFREQETYWGWLQMMVPSPPRAFWLILVALVLVIAVGYTATTLQWALGQLGWSHFTTQNTLLPSNTIYDILASPDEQMILGTESGAVIWSPPATTDLPDNWTVFTDENSPLPHNRVLSVARDAAGRLWFGTEAGLGSYDGAAWQTYRAADLGLAGDKVHALAVGRDDRLWVGTATGAAVFDGYAWTPITTATSGLVDDHVRALALEPRPAGDAVWFGTRVGVSRLDTASGEWTSFTEVFDPEWSVAALLYDSAGLLWAGTLGGGLGLWDGVAWRFYRTGNSEIPFNTVNEIAEVELGLLWVGTARPAEFGGVVAEFDGQTWRVYTPRNSGYSGAEPLAIAQDIRGRRWVGTRTTGVDIYQLGR